MLTRAVGLVNFLVPFAPVCRSRCVANDMDTSRGFITCRGLVHILPDLGNLTQCRRKLVHHSSPTAPLCSTTDGHIYRYAFSVRQHHAVRNGFRQCFVPTGRIGMGIHIARGLCPSTCTKRGLNRSPKPVRQQGTSCISPHKRKDCVFVWA